MKPVEKVYFDKCKRLIINKAGIGELADWKQRDYEKLCELIQEGTNVSLSLTTIKRLLNEPLHQLPQKATLNALAQYAGFEDWFDLIKNSPEVTEAFHTTLEPIREQTQTLTEEVSPVKKGWMRRSVLSFLIAVLFLAGSLFFVKIFFTGKRIKSFSGAVRNYSDIDTTTGKKFPGLALTPPMGWNAYNTFDTAINENLIRKMADKLVETGMRDAGYRYLVVDNGWQAVLRDQQGNLVAHPVKFPSGIKALADYVHSKGLKLGIFACTGNGIGYGMSGSRGREFQDARTFASWGIDYVKYVWTSNKESNVVEVYTVMRDAIYAAGRPMVFSMCEWGTHRPWIWGGNVAHLWRTSTNITDCANCVDSLEVGNDMAVHLGWKEILDRQGGLDKYAGPGHWNDLDMLEVGNPGLSLIESKAHFSMWCMLAAPLIAGNDLRTMTEDVRKILTNREVIAIDQDSLGKQAFRYSSKNGHEVWIKALSRGEWAFCFFNASKNAMNRWIDWDEFSMLVKDYTIRDVWKATDIGTTKNALKIRVKASDVALFRLKPSP